MFFTNKVLTYRGTVADTSYYRKTFTANQLPNVYCAFHYFKKNDIALAYYRILLQLTRMKKLQKRFFLKEVLKFRVWM